MITTPHSNIKRGPWKSERESVFFWIVPFMVCYLYVWMASTKAVTCTSAVDKWFTMYPSVFIVTLVHLFPFFAFIVTIQLTLLLGSSMRLNEGSIQISSQMLAKIFRKFLFWCLGWFSLKSLEILCHVITYKELNWVAELGTLVVFVVCQRTDNLLTLQSKLKALV